jgi:hypothetical protein
MSFKLVRAGYLVVMRDTIATGKTRRFYFSSLKKVNTFKETHVFPYTIIKVEKLYKYA